MDYWQYYLPIKKMYTACTIAIVSLGDRDDKTNMLLLLRMRGALIKE